MATKKTKAPTRTKSPRKKAAAPIENTLERRQQLIAVAAYLRAEKRGFAPGYELDDWIAAERDVDTGVGAQ